MKYYTIRILSGLFFMGSIGVGFLVGAEYGKWAGWFSFVLLMAIGILLHRSADKIQRA
jgi:hypothetical protein